MTRASRTAEPDAFFPLVPVLSVVLLAALLALTWHRSHVYVDAETLWKDTLVRNPDAFIANNNLGGILLARGELAPAAELFERALRVKPDYEEGFDNLGQVRQRQGRLDEAIGFYRQALRCEPRFANAHNNLGIVLAQQGKISEAHEEFAAAVRDKPTFAKAHQNLGLILERLGRTGEAVVEYRETLRLSTAARDVALRLAWILATDPDASVRNGAEAVRHAQSAAQAGGGNDPQAWDVLAAAYAEAGRFEDAVEAGERALVLAGVSAAGGAGEGAKARLALYRARQPFRRQAP